MLRLLTFPDHPLSSPFKGRQNIRANVCTALECPLPTALVSPLQPPIRLAPPQAGVRFDRLTAGGETRFPHVPNAVGSGWRPHRQESEETRFPHVPTAAGSGWRLHRQGDGETRFPRTFTSEYWNSLSARSSNPGGFVWEGCEGMRGERLSPLCGCDSPLSRYECPGTRRTDRVHSSR